MGIFDFTKKKKKETELQQAKGKKQANATTEEKLTQEGELPWGWIYRNKEFTDKIQNEYSYFLNKWIDSRKASPKERYESLKSFVLYLKDVEQLCRKKGECFEFWYEQILTSTDYLAKREEELKQLEQDFDTEVKKYENLQKELQYNEMRIPQLMPEVILKLQEHPGILQSDFWKLFNEKDKTLVSDIVYELVNSKKIEREKSGRSYKLFYKE